MTRNGRTKQRGFQIWVDGRLSERFAEGLAGIDQRDDDGATVLSGDYQDESHLQGVLDQLRSLGIGVRRFEVDAPRADHETDGPAPRGARGADRSVEGA